MKIQKKPSTAIIPCPVILLSVADGEKANIITLSWAGNVCSDPPSIAVGVRPSRYSHSLMKDSGEFVVNIPDSNLLDETIFCGTKSGRDYDKFEECELTPVEASKVSAPMIDECPINIESRITKIVNVGAHDLFISEVVAVHMDEGSLDDKGRIDFDVMKPFTYIPLRAEYWSLGKKMQ